MSISTDPSTLDAEANERHAVEAAKMANVGRHDELVLGAILRDFKPVPSDEALLLLNPLTWSSRIPVDDNGRRMVAGLTPDTMVQAAYDEDRQWVGVLYCTLSDRTRSFTNDTGQKVTFTPKEVLAYRFLGKGQQYLEAAAEVVAEIRVATQLVAAREIDGFGDNGEQDESEADLPE